MSTVKELKSMCRANNIKGYSKLKKAELEKLCGSFSKMTISPPKAKAKAKPATSLNKLTVVQLKQMCREKNIKGYSKLKKAELIKLCAGSPPKKRSPVKKTSPVKAKPMSSEDREKIMDALYFRAPPIDPSKYLNRTLRVIIPDDSKTFCEMLRSYTEIKPIRQGKKIIIVDPMTMKPLPKFRVIGLGKKRIRYGSTSKNVVTIEEAAKIIHSY